MSSPTPSFGINVDVTNPGQFFACCGLLELAHRLWPGAAGWFSSSDKRFCVQAADDSATLQKLVQELSRCPIEGLTVTERNELSQLEQLKRQMQEAGEALGEAQERRRIELGKKAREGQLVIGTFGLTLDWWQDEDTPATWAGKQEIERIARAAQNGIAGCLHNGSPLEDMLNWHLVLRTPTEYQSKKGQDKKVEPFYFDARRYAHPLDEGFSLDVQGAETAAYPATELLCLIGLQRFRPVRNKISKWSFAYNTWPQPLHVVTAAAAVRGLLELPGRQRFTFSFQFRDDQKRYKAFGFARPNGDSR